MTQIAMVELSRPQKAFPSGAQGKGKEKKSPSLTVKIPQRELEKAMTFLTGKEICLASQVNKAMSRAASSDLVWSAVSRNALGYPSPRTNISKWQALKLFMSASVLGEEIRTRSLSWKEREREDRNSSQTKNSNPLDRLAAVSPFLFSDKFTLLNAINFYSTEITLQTKEEIIKILLEKEKPTAKELLAAVNLCKRERSDDDEKYQERKAFALKIIELLVEKGAKPDTNVLNKALEYNFSLELIKSLILQKAVPDHKTLDLALEFSPECVPFLLENGARPSPNSLGHAFKAWGENRIIDETLERILKMYLESEDATISLGVLENAIFAKAPLSRIQTLIAIAIKDLSEDKKIALMRELLRIALILGPDERNENTQAVLNHLMNQVDHPTTKILNEALFRGHPIAVIKTLFDKGAQFDEDSFKKALSIYPSEEVVDFLIEQRAPFHLEMGFGNAILPLPILLKVLRFVKQTSLDDVLDALRRELPIDIVEKICSLCKPLSSKVLGFALENGLKDVVLLLNNKFGMQLQTKSYRGKNYYSNSFNDALKYSADDDWIKFVISLGARPERDENSYNFAVAKGASDFVLDYIESRGVAPDSDTFDKALKVDAPLRILHRLVKKQAPFYPACWDRPSAFSSIERFQLIYNYAKSRKVPLPEDFFDLAISNQAPLEVLDFILNKKIAAPTATSLDAVMQFMGRLSAEKLNRIVDKLLNMGLKFGVASIHRFLSHTKKVDFSKIKYFLDHGVVPDKETFHLLFSKELPDDLLEMLMKIYLQMRHFRSQPMSLRYDANKRIYIPVFPKAVAEPLESKAKV